MEDKYLEQIWNKPNKEMDEFLNINDPSFEYNLMKKIKSKLKNIILQKIVGIILGLGWISFMFMLIYLSFIYSPQSLGKVFFIGSLSAILLITSIAVFLFVKDLLTIKQIDYTGSVTNTQLHLSTLQLSIIRSVQVSWLQLPFYTTWYLNEKIITHWSILALILQIILTLALTGLALWLYFHINAKNLDKKWVCDFLRGTGMNSVTQTMSFIKELDDYK